MLRFVVLYPTFRHFRQDSDISDKIPTFAIGCLGKVPTFPTDGLAENIP
ncbi:MAG: hypothetical protein ACM65M_00920 [Microcoleus sp.]